jgi:hypothetical protein
MYSPRWNGAGRKLRLFLGRPSGAMLSPVGCKMSRAPTRGALGFASGGFTQLYGG